jgi:hypothetical protein
VDVARHQSFARLAPGFLRGGGEAFLAQDRDRLVDVAFGLGQRALAIHEPRAGSFAQLLDELRRDVRHACSYSCLAAA